MAMNYRLPGEETVLVREVFLCKGCNGKGVLGLMDHPAEPSRRFQCEECGGTGEVR
jgi:DnaJ-class molecular chaperone